MEGGVATTKTKRQVLQQDPELLKRKEQVTQEGRRARARDIEGEECHA